MYQTRNQILKAIENMTMKLSRVQMAINFHKREHEHQTARSRPQSVDNEERVARTIEMLRLVAREVLAIFKSEGVKGE